MGKSACYVVLVVVVVVLCNSAVCEAFFLPRGASAASIGSFSGVAAVSNVTVLTCNSDTCAKGTCTSSSIPSGVCQSGYNFRCASSLNQCLLLQSYQARDSCPAAQLLGNTGMMCDFCYRLINETNGVNTTNFIMRNCRSDQSRTLLEDCDNSCSNCAKKTKISRNTCYPFPGAPTEGSMIAVSVMPCNKVVFADTFDTMNCSGPVAMKSVIPANFCIGGGTNMSSEYVC